MQRPRRYWILAGLIVAVLSFAPAVRQLSTSLVWRLVGRPTLEARMVGTDARSFIDDIRSIRTLRDEAARLAQENLALQAEVSRLKELEHENNLLRAELQFAGEYRDRFDFQPVTIVARAPATALQEITINRGSRDGIGISQAVASGGFLIGLVRDVAETTATVQLITASRSRLPAVTATSRTIGVIEGGLAGLALDELPADTVLPAGEMVSTSGLGEIVPNGLPIGTIDQRLSSTSAFVQRYAIRSPIDFAKLELVMVLRPKGGI